MPDNVHRHGSIWWFKFSQRPSELILDFPSEFMLYANVEVYLKMLEATCKIYNSWSWQKLMITSDITNPGLDRSERHPPTAKPRRRLTTLKVPHYCRYHSYFYFGVLLKSVYMLLRWKTHYWSHSVRWPVLAPVSLRPHFRRAVCSDWSALTGLSRRRKVMASQCYRSPDGSFKGSFSLQTVYSLWGLSVLILR